MRAAVRLAPLVALAAALAACGGSAASREDDARFRTPGLRSDGRETVLITPPADSVRYLVFPAVVDSVDVRAAEAVLAPGALTTVEVLVKGALPDACAELDAVDQRRAGRYVTVALVMRQPRDRVCAAVVRPFRFYMDLVGTYAAGSYVMTLNGSVVPFQIRERAPEE